jgi:trimeric autotransporter adhesin
MGVRETGCRDAAGRWSVGARWLGVGIALLLLGVLPAAAQAALSSVADNDWVTNGPVYAIARSGNTVYLGGSFSQVGPRTGPAVSFTGGSSTPDASFPQVSGGQGEVRAAVSDGAGGWYLGGSFTHVGGVARTGLAHVLADGSVDPSFTPSVTVTGVSEVQALALSGPTLYVGGDFRTIDGTARNGLAAVTTADGSLQSWDPAPAGNTSSPVGTLAVSGGTLYVGGDFTQISGQPRASLAAFDTATGGLTSWAPQAGGMSPYVDALAVSGPQVYLAGSFDHVDGQARTAFAAVDTSGALTPWDPQASGCSAQGQALAVAATAVYVGGCFTQIGGQPRASVAALDPATGSATSWDPGAAGGAASAIAVAGPTVYVAGSFTQIGGQARNGVAALDATTATATAWNPNLNANAVNPLEVDTTVSVVATSGSQLLVGGSFSSAGGVARSDLAALDATTGQATAWDPGVVVPAFPLFGKPVQAISVAGGVVYVGGSFSSIGGQPRANLAAIDPATGAVTGWNPGASSPVAQNGVVAALLATPQVVYVGGSFTSLGGRPQSDLGAVDTGSGAATGWSPQVSAPQAAAQNGAAVVDTLALSGSTLYIGGGFTALGGQGRTGAGAVDTGSANPTSWNPVLTSPLPSQQPYVGGLALSGSTVYIAAGQSGLVAVDATSGAALPWHPDTNSNQAGVAVANGAVYLGGVALDAGSGLPLAWGPQPSSFGFGTSIFAGAIIASGNHVYLAGDFRTTDLAAVSGFAAYTITGPANTAAPTVAGTPAEGQTLTEHHGSWTGTPSSYAYQWLRCTHNPPFQAGCTPIAGATGPSYTLTAADVGATAIVQETATNAEGTSDPVGSAPTGAVVGPPVITTPPAITGTPSVGQTLVCSPGIWSNSPTGYQYAWLQDSVPIPGAASPSYTAGAADGGHDLTCQVTAANAAGSASASADAGTIDAGSGGGGSGGGGTPAGGGPGPTAGFPASPTLANSQGTSGSVQVVGPSPRAVAAALEALGTPTAAGPPGRGSYSVVFNAPSAGVLGIRWLALERGARRTKEVAIARGSRQFPAARRGRLTLRVGSAGRQLLKRAKTLKVVEVATFTPSNGAAQAQQSLLTLGPGKRVVRH